MNGLSGRRKGGKSEMEFTLGKQLGLGGTKRKGEEKNKKNK